MQDLLARSTVPGVRGFAAVTTGVVEEARLRHDCYPVATAALGRTLTAALLLAANLKNDETVTIRIAGDGPLGTIVTDARLGLVRGYLQNPHVNLPLKDNKLNVGEAVGKGQLYVTRFTGLKHPFTGSTDLVSGEIAEDLTHYLMLSEQTPSSIALGVLVQPDMTVAAAGGFFIQVMPEAESAVLDRIEHNLKITPPVSNMVHAGMSASEILSHIFDGLQPVIYEQTPLAFRCQCSRERIESLLINLGEQEVQEMLDDGSAEMICHFCSEKYTFDRDDLCMILNKIKDEKK